MNVKKYKANYFPPPERCCDWTARERIEKAPIWCSVDLRDGNQALVTPMELDEKLEFFGYLGQLGFKQIEVGFPAASETNTRLCAGLSTADLFPPT